MEKSHSINNDCLWQTHSQYYTKWGNSISTAYIKYLYVSNKERDKGTHFPHSYSIKIFNLATEIRQEKEGKAYNQGWGRQIIPEYRWFNSRRCQDSTREHLDLICSKMQYLKPTRKHKLFSFLVLNILRIQWINLLEIQKFKNLKMNLMKYFYSDHSKVLKDVVKYDTEMKRASKFMGKKN